MVCPKGEAKLFILVEVQQLRLEGNCQPQAKLQSISFQSGVDNRRDGIPKIIPFPPKLANIPVSLLQLILIVPYRCVKLLNELAIPNEVLGVFVRLLIIEIHQPLKINQEFILIDHHMGHAASYGLGQPASCSCWILDHNYYL